MSGTQRAPSEFETLLGNEEVGVKASDIDGAGRGGFARRSFKVRTFHCIDCMYRARRYVRACRQMLPRVHV